MHAHLGLASPAASGASERERAEASAKAQLDAGVLAIREPGGPNRASTGIGPQIGLPRTTLMTALSSQDEPRTVTAGRFLAPPGRYFPGLAREVSEDALPDAAEEEFRSSGAWAKVIGDTPLPGPSWTRTYGADALAEAAARVHAAGGRIVPQLWHVGMARPAGSEPVFSTACWTACASSGSTTNPQSACSPSGF